MIRRARCRTYPSVSSYSGDDDDMVVSDLIDDVVERGRRISFSAEVRLQSAVQEQDNQELCRILAECTDQHQTLFPMVAQRRDHDLDINQSNHSGLAPLHQAVLNGNLDSVKLLLTYGANPNIHDAYGYTPLHAAAACGARNIACLLIIHGGDLFCKTSEGDLAVDLSKDPVTADLLTTEMCRQIQQQAIIEQYGFAFKLIDIVEVISRLLRLTFSRCVKWTTEILDRYCKPSTDSL